MNNSGTPRRTSAMVLFKDKLANWVITSGGLLVIAAVLGIFVFIAATTFPLFQGAKLDGQRSLATHEHVQGFLVDELGQMAVLWGDPRGWRSLNLESGLLSAYQALPSLRGERVTASEIAPQGGQAILGLEKGRVWLGQMGFGADFDGKKSISRPEVQETASWTLDSKHKAIVAVSAGGDPLLVAALSQDGRLLVSLDRSPLKLNWDVKFGTPVQVKVSPDGQRIWVGTRQGNIVGLNLEDGILKQDQSLAVLGAGQTLSALGWVNGFQTLLAGASDGAILALQEIDGNEGRRLRVTAQFESLGSEVMAFTYSARDKGFAALDREGNWALYYKTGERLLLKEKLPSKPAGPFTMSPKANGLLAMGQDQKLHWFKLRNPHPETTIHTLFDRIWYEGYESPEFVWQSTGGSDDFESKLSLTPLIYGTLKGTFYALFFAVPLALLGAIYTSQFMSRQLRAWVKPTVEVMAAVPSVVMGFIAGLLLAPFVEAWLFTVLLGILAVPLITLAALWLWRSAPERFQKGLGEEREGLVLLAGLALGLVFVAALGPLIERALFLDFKVWMRSHWGVVYDQRNSLVVGFAMGFAVIPVIYTICEDALSSVPNHLISASLSCGATPWQTTMRVVLPVALSGIFSAIMVGFGRAVGETMIVLMATGNTAVMDFSAFTGFRALSANIAVEIPEAPVHGTLYRTLFFAALILFAMTFVVNTVAELVRLRLRKKYSQL